MCNRLKHYLHKKVNQLWFPTEKPNKFKLLSYTLQPTTKIYEYCAKKRKHKMLNHPHRLNPINSIVIVVGNITVGGTGKTPIVIALATYLKTCGYNIGIACRGTGNKPIKETIIIDPNLTNHPISVNQVGDEALLLSQETNLPIAVNIDRTAAADQLATQYACQIIITDDGLQHYKLHRDIEIAVIDGQRGFGNGALLPAGPLRESISRLNTVDFIISNGKLNHPLQQPYHELILHYETLQPLQPHQAHLPAPPKKTKVHGVATIGNPQRFFNQLASMNFEVIPHPMADHHLYTEQDLNFHDTLPVIMTTKDAIKCNRLNLPHHNYWVLPITIKLPKSLTDPLLELIKNKWYEKYGQKTT